MFTITPETASDAPYIDPLLDEAFGVDRRNKISYRYRDGVAPIASLSLAARDGERLIGTIRFWPIAIGTNRPALLLGPIAIAASHRGAGLGAQLMREGLARAGTSGDAIVVLVGDEPYYGRFGFVPAARHAIVMPDENPARVLVRELREGALAGVTGAIMRWPVGSPRQSNLR